MQHSEQRICVMKSRGSIAPYIMEDMAESLRFLGHEVLLVDMAAAGCYRTDLSAAEQRGVAGKLIECIQQFSPDLCFSYAGAGLIGVSKDANLFDTLGCPYVMFFFDGPIADRVPFKQCANRMKLHVACWDSAYLQNLIELGMGNVHYCPLATNARRFERPVQSTHHRKACFVGTVHTGLPKAPDQDLQRIQEAFISHRLQSPARPYHELLSLAEQSAPPQNLDAYVNFKQTSDFQNFLHDTMFLADQQYRYESVATVASAVDTHVYGSNDWSVLSLPTLHCHSPIDYFTELPDVYNRSEINLNLTQSHLLSAVNQRIFDAGAAGGFVLSDYRADAEKLFTPEEDLALFHSLEEMKEKLCYYDSRPEQRMKIARNLQQLVLERHTWDHRLTEILDLVL